MYLCNVIMRCDVYDVSNIEFGNISCQHKSTVVARLGMVQASQYSYQCRTILVAAPYLSISLSPCSWNMLDRCGGVLVGVVVIVDVVVVVVVARYRSKESASCTLTDHCAPISKISRASNSSFLLAAPLDGKNPNFVSATYCYDHH